MEQCCLALSTMCVSRQLLSSPPSPSLTSCFENDQHGENQAGLTLEVSLSLSIVHSLLLCLFLAMMKILINSPMCTDTGLTPCLAACPVCCPPSRHTFMTKLLYHHPLSQNRGRVQLFLPVSLCADPLYAPTCRRSRKRRYSCGFLVCLRS
jgi:hypothetical protein